MSGALAGRSAVVTGASRGIGLATSRSLSGEGARVLMLARGAKELRERSADIGAAAVALPCDVSDRAGVAVAAQHIAAELGGAPDILVNNAGLFILGRIDALSQDDFAASLDVNLIAPFLLIRAFLPAMRERGDGHIVTVGSIADRQIFPENAAYAASKFGLRGMHEVMRAELRGTGIRTTLVSPGPTDTPLWNSMETGRTGLPPRTAMLSAEATADAILYAVTRPATVNVDELRLTRA
ncbi:MAG: SDR family oxidoreductase [Anaerolineae bacterium]|nr:SDR family oxidoreductase [Gemmatimonadaceae bacterium]